MNLEKEFEEIIKVIPHFTLAEFTNAEDKLRIKAIKQCSELSQDIAIKFQKYCQKEKYQYDELNNEYVYMGTKKHSILSTQELFTLFLKEYEQPRN